MNSPKSEKCTRMACDQCTASKTRCDGVEPCQRCCKREVVCNFSSRRRSGPKRKRGAAAPSAASVPAKQATNTAAAPAAAAAATAGIAGGSQLHVAAVNLPGVSPGLVTSGFAVPLASAAVRWANAACPPGLASASFVMTAASGSPLSLTSSLTSSPGGSSYAPAAVAAFGFPPRSDMMGAGCSGEISPAKVQTPWQLHHQQQQLQQQQQQQQQQGAPPLGSHFPFFGTSLVSSAAGLVPPVSLGFSQADFAMMSMAQLPQPLPTAWEPLSLEVAALRADPRYLITYMDVVNSFVPLVEVSKLGEALAATPPPPPVLVGPDGGRSDAAAEAVAAAGEESRAHRAAIQALLWAAVGLGALFSGDEKCAARQMRLSRAWLQRCFDSPNPDLVAIFLLHVLYWFHKVDVEKVQRYMGYAQQAARDAGESSVHSDVMATLRFMSAVMRISVTTAVAYDPGAPRAPEVLARIKGPQRFMAIIEDVFFNMFLAFPPQGDGGYLDESMPARLTRALQEADAVLETMARPSALAKATVQGLHAYFQLAAGQTDLALRAAEGMGRSVSQEPMCLQFPPCFVLSRGVSSLLRSCGSMPAAFAIEAAMAPFYPQVVYANRVCSVGRELLRVFMSPTLTPMGVVDVTASSSGDRKAVLGSLSNSLVSCGGGGGGSSGGNSSSGGSRWNSSSGSSNSEHLCSGSVSPDSGIGGGGAAKAAAAAASPTRIKRESLVLDVPSCNSGGGNGGDGGCEGIDDIVFDGDLGDRFSPMSLSFLEGTIEAFPTPSCDSVETTASARISPPAVQQPTLLSPTPSPSLEQGQEPAIEPAMEQVADTGCNAVAQPAFESASPSASSSGSEKPAATSILAAPPLPPPVPSESSVLAPKATRLCPAKQALLLLQQHTFAADQRDGSPASHRASPFLFSPNSTSSSSPSRRNMRASGAVTAVASEEGAAAAAAAAGIGVAPSPMELKQQQQQQQQQEQQQYREVHALPQGHRGAAAGVPPSPSRHQGIIKGLEVAVDSKQLSRPRISISISSGTPAGAAATATAAALLLQVSRSPVTASASLASVAGSSAPVQQPQKGPPKALGWQKVLLQQQARQQSQLHSLQEQLQHRLRQQEAAVPMQLQRSPATAPMAMAGLGAGSAGTSQAGQHQQQRQRTEERRSPGAAAFQPQETPAQPSQQQQQRQQQQHLQLLQQQLLQQQQRHRSLLATAAAAQAASRAQCKQQQQPYHQPTMQAAAAQAIAAAQPQACEGLIDQKAAERSFTASLLLEPTPQQQEQQQQQQQQVLFSKPGQQQPREMSFLQQQTALLQQALPPVITAGGPSAANGAAGARDRECQDLQMLGLSL